MAVAPHHLASQSALAVLREGGSAIEAMVAAATIAVVYPHMNGLGGDGFWLIVPPEGDPIAIDASGAAGSLATPQAYAGLAQIPHRGPQAALTVAGTVSGWDEALNFARVDRPRCRWRACWPMPSAMPQTASRSPPRRPRHRQQIHELRDQPGFAETWLVDGQPPQAGSRFYQPALATPCAPGGRRSRQLYRGRWRSVWRTAWRRWACPSPWRSAAHAPGARAAEAGASAGELWNLAPPTQGLVSLAILGITDRLAMADADDAMTVHRIVEATKLAFGLRDAHITDPRH
jgi:gamma-glutamyltranspeptidase/glutathione hydrolase